MKKLILLSTLLAGTASAMTATEIMKKVDDQSAQTMESSFVQMTLTSCKFGLSNGSVRCVEQPRIKTLETVGMDLGDSTRSLMIVRQPASEQGIGMLSYNYDDTSKTDETWLYLSALDKVKRIATGSGSDDEPASIFGSEFTTEDQETGNIDEYNYRIVEETNFQGRAAWVIESIAKPEFAASSNYDKELLWIDKERFIVMKGSAFRDDNEVKRFQMASIEQVDGVWMARSITVLNLVANRLSNMKLDAIAPGIDADAQFLTQRALTDRAFREAGLDALRQQAEGISQ
ncbi:outer membrane lipoprotein-sorting protein [Salinibius halmophilus]|uniref:outer membrane lipoprotein-sorting protein n=1 Tax=Salinibius halmophilus TaxID=1853216 RepID=UPI000E66C521|nr:outer membrane lipoprotein-sorting protein [Salinibius halmophilus]